MEAEGLFASGRVLIVAAHPDDETLGAGAQLPMMGGRVTIVHATDGAPRNMDDATRAGFSSREAYAEARREELLTALAYAGIASSQCRELGHADQEASFNLRGLTEEIAFIIREVQPEWILTHPYEGGHPDHDACALATHCALTLARDRHFSPVLYEFTSYHAGPQGILPGEFLPVDGIPVSVCNLNGDQQKLKCRMIEAFLTQRAVLSLFGTETELFRPAPQYDFTQPPHEGKLLYENFNWGTDGAHWRELAREALEFLGLTSHATQHS